MLRHNGFTNLQMFVSILNYNVRTARKFFELYSDGRQTEHKLDNLFA